MISVTILCKNSSTTLFDVLQSVAGFEEVILIDTGSTDGSMDIAKGFSNVTLYERPFTSFGPLHNEAATLASHDWILSLDSDEVLTTELASEILALDLDTDYLYGFCFDNFFKGKQIKHSGWSPDKHVRIYNKTVTQFSNASVHESIQTQGLKVRYLKGHVKHYSYQSIADFLKKMQLYSDLFAKGHAEKKKGSFGKAWLHSAFAFFKTYILKRGFLDGKEGYIIAKYNADTAWYKYLKLHEKAGL